MARPGRPQFQPTPAKRRKVAELASCDMAHADIARAIGCSEPTLRKHFREELDTGAAVKRAEVIAMLYKSARGGNVSAQKRLLEETRAGVAAQAMRNRASGEDEGGQGGEPPAPTPKAEKLGKKGEAKKAAEVVAADGDFAVPAGPRLVVSNNG